ncbi:unnamed protein product [Peronospora belbahrii]|uniref:Uncharacterized protein n=1 Tax=Peronospora belbahrii TaxID=622444 RepID=A0ABN8CN45_9STRA|nr:unnamed protein product [Peronospora belbahrii]
MTRFEHHSTSNSFKSSPSTYVILTSSRHFDYEIRIACAIVAVQGFTLVNFADLKTVDIILQAERFRVNLQGTSSVAKIQQFLLFEAIYGHTVCPTSTYGGLKLASFVGN